MLAVLIAWAASVLGQIAADQRLVHDGTTFEVVGVTALPRNPHGAAFSGDGRRAYIACAGDDVVVEFDLGRSEVVGRFAVAGTPLDVALTPDGKRLLVTQFQKDSVLSIAVDGGEGRRASAPGEGPSLFSRGGKRGRRYLVSERADKVSELSAEGEIERVWETGRRPYPGDVTSDGILLFVPNRDGNSVSVIDTLNNKTVGTTAVPAGPEGGAVRVDDVDYVVACNGADQVAFINTASFTVVKTIGEGVGPRPFGVTMGLDGRYALVNNAGGDTVSVLDVVAREVVGRLRVGKQPIVVRAHPDGERFLVMCEGDHHVAVVRMTRAAVSATEKAGRGGGKTKVAVMGMIHSEHRTSERYGLEMVRGIIAAYGPDDVCVELPANRFEASMEQWRGDRKVTEERTRVFPEYVDALLPMQEKGGFTIIPTAGWTKEMNDYRRDRLREISKDPARSEQWSEYERSMETMERRLEELGARAGYRGTDDPRLIHSEEYDRITGEADWGPYNRYFNDDLADGGWDNINAKHYANIARHLDRVRGEGRRVLITYGAAHKAWFMRALRGRSDVEIVDLRPFIDQAERAMAKPDKADDRR